jgi:DNA-binding NtrC family response regulator
MKTVLVVDDEVEVGKSLRRLLRKDFKIELAHTGADALTRLEGGGVDLVLSDFRMPGMNGAELLAEVHRRWPEVQRLMLSGFADFEACLASVKEEEVGRFLRKPWDNDQLIATLKTALEIS